MTGKRFGFVAAVVGFHLVAVMLIALMPGCGTVGPGRGGLTRGSRLAPPESVPMPKPEPVVVAPVPVKPVAAPRSSGVTEYTVARGDTLSGIAYRYNLRVSEIVVLNNLASPDKIAVGQKLVLPGKIDLGAGRTTPARVKVESVAAEAGGELYTVKAGDYLSGIAKNFGTSVAAIKKLNSLSSDKIMVGQKLVIPKGSKSVADVDKVPVPAVVSSGTEIAVPAVAPEKAKAAAAAPVEYREYTVSDDLEDLYSVGMMWGVSPQKLKEVNGLKDTVLVKGQKLKIPPAE